MRNSTNISIGEKALADLLQKAEAAKVAGASEEHQSFLRSAAAAERLLNVLRQCDEQGLSTLQVIERTDATHEKGVIRQERLNRHFLGKRGADV